MRKRILPLLLALLMVLQLCPMTALASNSPDSELVEVVTVTNSAFSAESEPETTHYAERYWADVPLSAYATTFEGAVQQLRKAMLAHEKTIVVYYRTTEKPSPDLYDIIRNEAYMHTGNSQEGKTLKYSYSGCAMTQSFKQDGDSYLYQAKYEFNYLLTLEQEAALTNKINSVIKSFGFTDSTSDYEKVKTIYDYITSHVVYDYEGAGSNVVTVTHTAYGAMMNGTAVCNGYSLLLYRMCLEVGVNCRYISGYSTGLHAWNIIEIDDLYYLTDSTWDAGADEYKWFLRGSEYFPNHIAESPYSYESFAAEHPISPTDYLPVAAHVHEYLGPSIIAHQATCFTNGYSGSEYYCSICNHRLDVVTEVVPALTHEFNGKLLIEQEPTCDKYGYGYIYCSHKTCQFRTTTSIPKTDHTDANKDQICDSCGNSICSHEPVVKTEGYPATCKKSGYTDEIGCKLCGDILVFQRLIGELNHNIVEKIVAPTCTAKGSVIQTCANGCGYFLSRQLEPAHRPIYAPALREPTCTEDGLSAPVTCSGCGSTLRESAAIPSEGHDYVLTETLPADCFNRGQKVYVCTKDSTHTKKEPVYSMPALGCNWVEVSRTEPTCTKQGTIHYVCANNSKHTQNRSYGSPLGHTDQNRDLKCDRCGTAVACDHRAERVDGKDATCTEDGYTSSLVCKYCGETMEESTVIPAKGHMDDDSNYRCDTCGTELCTDHKPVIIKGYAATCTKEGITDGSKCSICGKELTAQTVIPAKGHTDVDKDYRCDVCKISLCTDHRFVTVKGYPATCTKEGLTDGEQCSICGGISIEQFAIPMLQHNFENGKCTECGTRDTAYNPFIDVANDDFFYDPVLWALVEEITTGTSENTFSPENPCTRDQVVTFLWRAMGKPVAENRSNPFVDVKEGDYFYEAVLWAVENGITTGTSATTFSPTQPCTRAQVCTFLWRTMGKPETDSENVFEDLEEGVYYYAPVLWAKDNAITTGTSATTFSPDATCTRGQIVTFLYRCLSKK